MAGATCGIHEALWLARLYQRGAKALYLHLPFCRRKCAYCDFSSWQTDPADPLVAAYCASLSSHLSEAASVGLLEGCETAYVGGGTPTLVGLRLPELIRQIVRVVPGLGELTCEANPDSLDDCLLAQLPEEGCTRVSLGVQSLCDDELRALGRLHDGARALDRIDAVQAAGLRLSCDLMCALPGQTDGSWEETLARLIDRGVGHVSVYPLQIEEGTPLAERIGEEEPSWHDPEVQARRMEVAQRLLSAAGLERYEVASYARDGEACRHNQAYWTAQPYLGLGTQASSMLTAEGYRLLRKIAPQLPAAGEEVTRVRLTCTNDRRSFAAARSWSELRFDLELLDAGQAAAEDLMLGMRMVAGVGPGLVAHARKLLGHAVDEAFTWCARRGLAQERQGSWVPTSAGWLLGNELYGRLWDLAPGVVANASVEPVDERRAPGTEARRSRRNS